MSSPKHRSINSPACGTPERGIVDRVRVLSRIAARGQSRELKGPNQVVPSAKSQGSQKLEPEAKQIRLDKGYWDKSAPSHRALQSRMADIMGQLHGE
jgi:hypothetical protein